MRRIGLAGLLAMLLTMAGLGLVASSAMAGTSVGSFEIDGNTPDSPAGEPTDWDAKVADQNPPLTVTPFTDTAGKNDDSFGMGSKQEEPGNWSCITGSSPGKGDITPGGKVAFRTINGKQYVYVNFTRKTTEGSADIDYEFNQSGEPNPSCPALPKRTAGDIVIAFDAENGGAKIQVRAFVWNGNATTGSFVEVTTGLVRGVTWDGATNGDGSNKTGNFGEAVLNLTDTIGEVSCGEFSSVFMKSRSSVEINSALQDRTAKKPVATGLCPTSSLTKTVRNNTANPTGMFGSATDAKPGDIIEYALSYTNAGPGTAHNVVVTDTLAAGQTLVAGSCSPACSVSGSTLTWNLGTVAPGTVPISFRVQITGTFAAGTSTPIKNIANVTTTEEPAPGKNSTETTVNVKTPSTTANKDVRNVTTGGSFDDGTPNSASASPGNTLEYRIVVTNSGPGTATGVVVTDNVATGSSYVANSCTGGTSCSFTSPTVTWQVGTIAAGGSVTLTFRVTLALTFPAGTTQVKNTAVVDSDQEPPKNSDETTTNVTANPVTGGNKDVRNVTAGGSFDDGTPNSASAKPGDTIEYRIVVSNTGNATATGVVVTDTVASGSSYVANSCTGGTSCSFTSPTVTWNVGTIAAGGSVTLTFKVTLASSFPAGTTQVKNVAVVDSDQEPPKNSDETTTNVTANPVTGGNKDVRNVTAGGSFDDGTPNSASAKPGDTIEYRIVVSNTGNAPATGVVVTDNVASGSTYVANSCTGGTSCSFTSPTVTWQVGTINAGASATLTFRVTLSGPFSGTTTIKNVAVVDTAQEPPKNSDETVVTVVGDPKLTLNKAADKTKVVADDQITYTLTYGNTGDSTATSSVITETIPGGTEYVSCTGGCTVSGSTVTWSVGPVAPNGGGSVTLTVRVKSNVDQCTICNVAQIASPDQNGGTAVNSNQVCVAASPASDPSTAKASGDALGLRAYVPLLSIPLVNVNISHAASSQTGPGNAADDDEFLDLDILGVVGLTSVARAEVLRTTSASQVTKALGARQTSTSEVLGLDVLSGVVTADVVRSVASTTATGGSSSQSAAGSTAANLKVLGQTVANASPGTRIPLDGTLLNRTLYGRGSYVAVNEQTGSTSGPASGQLSGGTYKADLTVTAVRVYITGGTIGGLLTLGGAPVDITVAKATAHSEHKQTRVCPGATNTQAVSGNAFIASAQVDPLLPTATVGFVEIPASGGSANKGVTAAVLPSDGAVVNTQDAVADTTGTNGATSSTASSYAQVAGACVLKVADPDCLIRATLIRSQANSTANSSSRSSNATGTQFTNLVVAGIPIAGTPPPNTVITLPLGLGFVILNEQVPDGAETGHTGLTVRAIRVKLNLPLAPLLRGAEVIVAQAHSDATFR